jgi:hypothetical protein
MKISDFYDDTVTVTVNHRGRTFEVECYPERSTLALGEEANAIASDKEQGVAKGEWHVIKSVVKSWTLEDDFSEASVLKMSQGFRRAIIGAVGTEAAFPTEAESTENSASTSAQTDNTGDSLAGTE